MRRYGFIAIDPLPFPTFPAYISPADKECLDDAFAAGDTFAEVLERPFLHIVGFSDRSDETIAFLENVKVEFECLDKRIH